jgi:hypothetical protein
MAMLPLEGGIFVSRRILHHEVFQRDDYTRAWILLLLLANDRPRTITLAGQRIEIKRGQLAWSLAGLQKQLDRGKEWLNSFLKFCRDFDMVHIASDRRGTIITILNYDAYNPLPGQVEVTDAKTDVAGQQTAPGNSDKAGGDTKAENNIAKFSEHPSDVQVADFCKSYLDLNRGITSIPEVWWRSWLSYMHQRPNFPKNWREALKQAFLRDFIIKHPKALGQMPSQEMSHKGSSRERGELYQLIAQAREVGDAKMVEELKKELAALPPLP